MNYYMIIEKGSGKFFPESRWGYTHNTPTDDAKQKPRLFTSVKSAQGALVQWCRGPCSTNAGHMDMNGDWVPGGNEIILDPDRIRDNFEIMEVRIERT